MKLFEQIKLDSTAASKAGEKEKRLLLSTLLGEIQRVEPEVIDGKKTWTDEQIIKVVKKMIDGNIETGKLDENAILSVYMPQSLTSEQLEVIISNLITENNYSGMKDMGKVMAYLTTNYSGQYDGKIVSGIVKSKIS